MSKDIPEIDDLTRGINDSELILTEDTVETQVEQRENNNETQEKDTAVSFSDTGCWYDLKNALTMAFTRSERHLPCISQSSSESARSRSSLQTSLSVLSVPEPSDCRNSMNSSQHPVSERETAVFFSCA